MREDIAMTNAAVERSDSQRSQSGPRVSFNRDVHVKRIGARQPADYSTHPYPTIHSHVPPLRRELPKDLTDEQIRREAALVLAQAAQVQCTVEDGNDSIGRRGGNNAKVRGRVERKKDLPPDRFHSLPSRKKNNPAKAVGRSSSDASTKKNKKPSIFSIFSSKKSNSQGDVSDSSQPKKVSRSRSDVGSREPTTGIRKRNNSENDESLISKKKSVPLSPIIENPSRQSYFDIDVDETADPPSGNIGFTNQSDLDLVPSKPVRADADDEANSGIPTNVTPVNGMHSSQQPANKLPLTKGVKVDGIVKQLAMERFSPVPHLQGPTFSYTRPNNETKIVYAQVQNNNHHSNGSRAASPQRYPYNTTNGVAHSPVPFVEKPARNPSALRSSMSPPKRWPHDDENDELDLEYQNRPLADEAPIVPVIREYRHYPCEPRSHQHTDQHHHHSHHRHHEQQQPKHGQPNKYPEFNSLSNRRKQLESRITSRKIGSVEHIPVQQQRNHSHDESFGSNRFRSHSMGRDISPSPTRELSYGRHPDRSDRKYSPDHQQHHHRIHRRGSDGRGNNEVLTEDSYDETDFVQKPAAPFVHSSRSPIIDLGYIEDLSGANTEPDDHFYQQQKYREQQYRHEFEPKSLDSQFSESIDRPGSPQLLNHHHREFVYPEQVHSLRREQPLTAQRSVERGDSGIEHDYGKRSSPGTDEIKRTRWRTPSIALDTKTQTEQFLRRERMHSERLQASRYNHIFRERSIDDGSHFDPRLDKYPSQQQQQHPTTLGTIRSTTTYNRNRSLSPNRFDDANQPTANTQRRGGEKKLGLGLKVKQLFTGKKKAADDKLKEKDKYVASEEDVTQGYRAYNGDGLNIVHEPKFPDIATRRRLSTPKASPLPKRTIATPSTSPAKPMRTNVQTTKHSRSPDPISPQKKGWYKSLERLTSSATSKPAPPSKLSTTSKINNNHITTSHNKDIRLSKEEFQGKPSTVPSPLRSSSSSSPSKNLRFFGDTDLDSNPPTISKATTATLTRKRTPLSTLNESTTNTHPRKNAATLLRTSETSLVQPEVLTKSSKKEFRSSSKHLQNISESASDNDEPETRGFGRLNLQKIGSRSSPIRQDSSPDRLRNSTGSSRRLDVNHSRASEERPLNYRSKSSEFERDHRVVGSRSPAGTTTIDSRKPPTGSHNKSISSNSRHSIDRRRTQSRDRERVVDSSGTEGDSSQQSQRSVVYLHATTVGAIPQPYILNTRRAKSREELSSIKSSSIAPSAQLKKPQQPMSRTVSRSLSVLAPWTPKHIHEGYEINYSQENQKTQKLRKDKSTAATSRKYNDHVHSTGTLPARFKGRDTRRETVSIPRR